MKLIKYSTPGWVIEVSDETEAAKILWPHICVSCRIGGEYYDDEGELIDKDEPVFEDDLDGMLYTACGCEYGVEDE